MPHFDSGIDKLGYEYKTDPATLTAVLKAMLWISLAMSGVMLVSDWMELQLLSREAFTDAEAEANDTRQMIVGLVYLAVAVVTAVVFLKWVYRANSNCRGFGASGMQFTPGWSVGYYFVPIMNFFRPYQAMKEIWKVSRNPAEWQKQEATALLGFWWGLWLFTGFLSQVSFRASLSAETIDEFQTAARLAVIEDILDIPLCLVVLSLIGGIAENQEKLVRPRSDEWSHSW